MKVKKQAPKTSKNIEERRESLDQEDPREKINQVLMGFNTTDIDYKELFRKESGAKGKNGSLRLHLKIHYLLKNFTFILRNFIIELLVLAFVHAPLLQIAILVVLEISFLAYNIWSFMLFREFLCCLDVVSKVAQSSTLLFIYFQFIEIWRKNIYGREDTSYLQRRAIIGLSVGAFLEYFFVVLKLLVLCYKRREEKKKLNKVKNDKMVFDFDSKSNHCQADKGRS